VDVFSRAGGTGDAVKPEARDQLSFVVGVKVHELSKGYPLLREVAEKTAHRARRERVRSYAISGATPVTCTSRESNVYCCVYRVYMLGVNLPAYLLVDEATRGMAAFLSPIDYPRRINTV
jgi:hypothetical protein